MLRVTFAIGLLLLSSAAIHAADHCKYDVKALLALDENAFDQDLRGKGGGWRAIASVPGCELAAADLLAAYRERHPGSGSIISWHEGQMRATAGQYERAIPLLESARQPPDSDLAGWNYYVDASVAFLRHDKPALLAAREHLAAVPYPTDAHFPPLKDGYFELPTPPGRPVQRMRWPPNIDVVDELIACFDQPYSVAYGRCHSPGSPP